MIFGNVVLFVTFVCFYLICFDLIRFVLISFSNVMEIVGSANVVYRISRRLCYIVLTRGSDLVFHSGKCKFRGMFLYRICLHKEREREREKERERD